jgi:hypothetical protein
LGLRPQLDDFGAAVATHRRRNMLPYRFGRLAYRVRGQMGIPAVVCD